MSEYDNLNDFYRTNHYDPLAYARFGRVGNSADGQGFDRVQLSDQTIRVDDTGTYTYIGFSIPGTAEATALWKIKRVTNADNTIVFADGNPFYDNVWTNRATYTYT